MQLPWTPAFSRRTPRWAASRPGWIPEEFLWVMGCSYRGIPPGDAVVRNPICANMSFRREVVTGVLATPQVLATFLVPAVLFLLVGGR